MHKKSITLLMIITTLLISKVYTTEAGKMQKPLPPLRMESSLLNEPALEGLAEIRLTVEPLINAQKLVISCKLPEGLGLSDSKEEWRGQAYKNKKIVLLYEIPVSGDIYYRVVFKAKIEEEGFIVAASSIVEINPSKKKIEKPRPRVIKKLSNGTSVIEMKGE